LGLEIRVSIGSQYRREDLAACQEITARKERKRAAQKQADPGKVFRISDVKMSKKERKWLLGAMEEIKGRLEKSLQEEESAAQTRKKRAKKASPGQGD